MLERFFHLYLEHPLELTHDLATVIPIVVGLFYANPKRKEIRFLLIYFVFLFFRNLISNIYATYRINNIFLYNFFNFIEIIGFGLTYYFNINKSNFKFYILIGSILVIIINVFFWETNEFSAGILTLTRIFGLSIALFYFVELLAEMKVKNILKHSLFWVSSGIIIHSTGTILIFLFSKIILSTRAAPDIFFAYWNFILIMYIVFCLFVSVGFWVSKYDEDNYA
ncbi:hypothetical protein [Larkinella rosea]|uniref:Uncharacterized protein n=1 Tax=Larkinella rosea TaxID=2025312 RepID=A0A3P1B9J0_9BACT|nr:hypothetical protein [Larkinella rosea]RRA97639.1 hypothetical protein EHT25_31830 [Larkinella rosea]